MLAGRVVAALAHGGYFGIGAVLAASLVPATKRASAVAALFAGLTIANVLGMPAGAFVGQQFGWRMVFWIISALGVLALVGLIALVPRTEPEQDQLSVARQFRTLARPVQSDFHFVGGICQELQAWKSSSGVRATIMVSR